MTSDPQTTEQDPAASERSAVTSGTWLPHERSHAVALFCILLVGLILRLAHMRNEDAWFDEVSTLMHLSEPTLSGFLAKVQLSNAPLQPLYPTLEYSWSRLIGASDISLRFLSLIPAMVTVYLAYLFGTILESKRVGLLAAFLLSVSPTHIYYSEEIRMYAQVLCLMVFSLVCLVRIARSGGRLWWVLHFLTTVLIVWTHMLGAIILPIEALYLAWILRRRGARVFMFWSVLQVVAVATLFPWFLTIEYDNIEEAYVKFIVPSLLTYFEQNPGYSVQGMFTSWLTLRPLEHASAASRGGLLVANATLVIAYVTAFLHLMVNVFIGNRSRDGEPNEREARGQNVLLLGLVVSPVLILLAISYAWQPSFMFRYALVSLLGLYFVLAMSIGSLKHQNVRRTITVIVVLTTSFQAVVSLQAPSRAPWKMIFSTAVEEPEVFVNLHSYGNAMYHMNVVADHHFGGDLKNNRRQYYDRTKITFYKSFDDLELYLLDHYANGRANSKRYVDVVVSISQKGGDEVLGYLDRHQIPYTKRPMHSYSPTYYIRIDGALD